MYNSWLKLDTFRRCNVCNFQTCARNPKLETRLLHHARHSGQRSDETLGSILGRSRINDQSCITARDSLSLNRSRERKMKRENRCAFSRDKAQRKGPKGAPTCGCARHPRAGLNIRATSCHISYMNARIVRLAKCHTCPSHLAFQARVFSNTILSKAGRNVEKQWPSKTRRSSF